MFKDSINNFLKDKSILILGFGREGRSTLNYIIKNKVKYSKLAIADKNVNIDKEYEFVEYFLGDNYLDCINQFDVIIKAPGISLKNIDLKRINAEITSQAELFLKFGKEKVIGVTGTKGKSTTTTMIYNILSTKYKVEIVGNIGIPVLNFVDNFEETDYFVYEFSSHQLELIDASPKIAVFLNLYQDHLDYYSSFEAYANAKRNIYMHQTADDILIYNLDMEVKLFGKYLPISKRVGISQNEVMNNTININGNILSLSDLNLSGNHNKYNFIVACTIARMLNVEDEKIIEGIKGFKSLPHRLEKIRRI
ncbi:MAG: hypothetical protein IKV94_06075 [Clostridia bacterium]|nr:hypothetical protein [Clostridia bacterium]